MSPQKIVVVGSPGAGKTTIAAQLSKDLNLPHFQVDHVSFMPGWKRRSDDEILDLVKEQLKGQSWISDGIYIKTVPLRIKDADLIIYVKSNPVICAWRVTKRWLKGGSYQAEGCPSKISFSFLEYILWIYPRFHKKEILGMLNAQDKAPVLLVRNYSDINMDLIKT